MGSRRSYPRKQYLERIRLEEDLRILRRSNKLWYQVRMVVTKIMKEVAKELHQLIQDETRCLLSLTKLADSMIKLDQPACLFVEWRMIKILFDIVQEQRVKFQASFMRVLEPVKCFVKRPAQREYCMRRMGTATRRATARWIKKTDEDATDIEFQTRRYKVVWNELKAQLDGEMKVCLQRTEQLIKANEKMTSDE